MRRDAGGIPSKKNTLNLTVSFIAEETCSYKDGPWISTVRSGNRRREPYHYHAKIVFRCLQIPNAVYCLKSSSPPHMIYSTGEFLHLERELRN